MKVIKKFSYLCFLILLSLIVLGSGVLADDTPTAINLSSNPNFTVTGTTATLKGNLTLQQNQFINFTGTGVTTLNLNNWTITGDSTYKSNEGLPAIQFNGNANFRINGPGTITGASQKHATIMVPGGNVTLNNVTVEYTGSNNGVSAVQAGVVNQPFPVNLTIGGGSTINSSQGYGIVVTSGSTTTVNINDCTITTNDTATVGTNAKPTNGGTGSITINVGQNNTNPTLKSSNSAGMYLPDDDATVNIYSGEISGASGIILAGGTLNIPGNPTITGTGAYSSGSTAKPGEGNPTGAGITVEQKTALEGNAYGKITLNITGSADIGSENGNAVQTTTASEPNATQTAVIDINLENGYYTGGDGQASVDFSNAQPDIQENAVQGGGYDPAPDQSYIDEEKVGVEQTVTYSNGKKVTFFGKDRQDLTNQTAGYAKVSGLRPIAYSPVTIPEGSNGGSNGEGSNSWIPGVVTKISSISMGDNFLHYYQLKTPSDGIIMDQTANANNLELLILPSTAFANSLNWQIKSLSGSSSVTLSFPSSSSEPNWYRQVNTAGQTVMCLPSSDGNWEIQQVLIPTSPNATTYTPGNTYLCYNGSEDGTLDPGLYELTASSGSVSDSIRLIVTGNTVTDVNIVKPSGQGNPVTFDINQTQSYDFEFETDPAGAPANVVEWTLTSSEEYTDFPAGDYAYVNPQTGNVTFLQATPPGVYLTLSVSVNGVESSNNLVIELTGQWKVEEGIAAYLNPVTVQSNQAYDLSSNIVATPTYVPIGNPEFLTFELTNPTPGVILTLAGRLIPQNTNYSGVVPITAEYDDGEDSYTVNFSVIFTPRAVAPTQVTAAPDLNFVTGSQATQNVLASLLPKGSGSTPGTTAPVTPNIFEYRSSDTSVAVVDSYGNVKAVTEGTATITTSLKGESGITLNPPTGTTLAEAEVAQTQVTVTSTPTQVPATGITVSPNDTIYLSPTNVEDGTHEQTVTVTLTPENTTDSVTAESSNTGVATVTGEGPTYTISAVSDGNTTVTFTAGSAKATVPVSVNSEDLISSGLTYSANSPDTFSITAGGVMVNPAIPSLQGTQIDNVTFMAWSGPDQGDMQTFTVNAAGNNSFSSETFSVNGNDRYFYNADNIFVEAYANNSQVYLGSLSPNYDWINTSTAGSSDTVAYITYQENNGFNTPTAFNGAISGVTGKNLQLEGIRVSSNIEGVDVVTDVHLQDLGWVEAVNDGVYAGTQHQARQMEAIRLRLVGDNAVNYDIWAQGHVENTGWMQPVKLGNNVDFVGTTGKALQLEAVKIQIVPKGQTPAGWEAFN